MIITNWKRIKGQSLPNLHVALNIEKREEKELGFIYKPRDDRHSKNAWRVHIGIGKDEQFVGHADNKHDAKKKLKTALDARAVAATIGQ